MLPTRAIAPLGTCQTVPEMSRRRVVRSPTELHRADGIAEIDHVADAVLVLDQHEHAGQQVAHDRLGAEADGDADDAGARDERSEIHVEFAEQHHERNGPDDGGGDALEQRAQRRGPLAGALGALAQLLHLVGEPLGIPGSALFGGAGGLVLLSVLLVRSDALHHVVDGAAHDPPAMTASSRMISTVSGLSTIHTEADAKPSLPVQS